MRFEIGTYVKWRTRDLTKYGQVVGAVRAGERIERAIIRAGLEDYAAIGGAASATQIAKRERVLVVAWRKKFVFTAGLMPLRYYLPRVSELEVWVPEKVDRKIFDIRKARQ